MTNSRRKRGVALGACLLGLTIQLTALAENLGVPTAFQDAGAVERVGRSVGLHAPAPKGRTVLLNPAVQESATLELNLEPGLSWTAEATRVEVGSQGDFTWEGRLVGEPMSEVRLVSRGGAVAGSIERPMEDGNVTYTLRPAAGGVSVLSELAPGDLPEGCAVVPAPVERRPQLQGGARLAATTYPTATEANPAVVDVLVVYTPATRSRYGGRAGVEAVIADAMASANTGYRNSGVYLSLNLVYAGEVPYQEDQDMNHALARLANPTDGYMDTVAGLRETYGADLVVLIDQDANLCGVSYQMGAPSVLYASTAFSVVNSGCLSTFSFAHEVGHTMGSQHDRGNSVLVGAYPYSYGYRWCVSGGTGFRTVMGYPCSNVTVPRVNYYSNPRLTFNGVPTGVPETTVGSSADNAKSLNNTAHIVEAFRARPLRPPAAPIGLTAGATSTAAIALAWTDASTNETSMVIERSLDAVAWSSLATLGSNTVAYADTGLTPETTYTYRVRACNNAGCSAWSATATATTSAALNVPTSLTAGLLATGEVRLDWVDSNTAAEEVQVERSAGAGDWALAARLSPASRTWKDTVWLPGTTYRYHVRVCNFTGCSGWSEPASLTTPPIPGTPSPLAATATSAGGISLRWDGVDGWTVEIRVERSTASSGWGVVAELPGTGRQWVDTAVQPGSSYAYRVIACGVAGCSGYSATATATVPWPVPTAPAGVTVVALPTGTGLSVTWSSGSAYATGFRIERSTDGVVFATKAILAATQRGYTDTAVSIGIRYYYRVVALGSTGNSAPSNVASGMVPRPAAPAVPTGLKAVAGTSPGSMVLTWVDNSTNESSFVLQSSRDGKTFQTLAMPPANSQSFTVWSLTRGTRYYFQIRAVGITGTSAWSSLASAVVP